MGDKAIVILKFHNRKKSVDLEVPLDITANELVAALNSSYDLGMDISTLSGCYLKAENPIALLRGSKTLSDFGIRNGSMIHITE